MKYLLTAAILAASVSVNAFATTVLCPSKIECSGTHRADCNIPTGWQYAVGSVNAGTFRLVSAQDLKAEHFAGCNYYFSHKNTSNRFSIRKFGIKADQHNGAWVNDAGSLRCGSAKGATPPPNFLLIPAACPFTSK